METDTIYDELILHITPDKFVIEPLQKRTELLVLDRVSQEITLLDNQGQIPTGSERIPICGILGTIKLLAGPYLIVITKRQKVGEINGQGIWRIEDIQMFSYSRTLLHLTDQQVNYNKQYVQMIQSVLQTPSFYFSASYDLSHTLQRLHHTSPEFRDLPYFERADHRFVWNAYILRNLAAKPELSRYCLPVIHGYVCIKQCGINQRLFNWALISRRSCLRAGTRYYMRGVDAEGHVANYVETEQIVESDGARSSFVQTRGSIPLFWNQYPNLKYKPRPVICQNLPHLNALMRHFDSQIISYGKQVLINLIDHRGSEDKLEKAFDEYVQQAKNGALRYVSFDFHHECGKMRWDRLSLLMDQVASDLEDFGYFMMIRDGSAPWIQEGIFRTNCVDCLDRTNVVQSMLARRSLQKQLLQLGILHPHQKIEDQVHFEVLYKNAWADNADICSVQYAGTGALKTDFTRTGKRTKLGLMRDGLNSMIRYYKNNFADGFRQDSISLFLGHHEIEESEGTTSPCPLKDQQDLKIIALPVALLIAVAMCFLSLLMATDTIIFSVFWAFMVVAIMAYAVAHGREFVDKPKLKLD